MRILLPFLNSQPRRFPAPSKPSPPARTFYGWWVVAAAFLNLFFAVGVVYYGFPVFYPSLVKSLGFTHADTTQGFLIGFIAVGLPFGFLAGAMIDRVGARAVILSGIGFVGASLILMGWMSRLWQYDVLCTTEVLGYVLVGPIPNQVLITNWFQAKRGRAMGYSYLGLGLGGAASPVAINALIGHFGWRHAFEAVGAIILVVLFPVGIWVTRSAPADLGLIPDGVAYTKIESTDSGDEVKRAVRTANFWLILVGCTLVIGAIGAVIQHFILFLENQGYSSGTASVFSSCMLVSSLAGRVLVGYLADQFRKKNVMALFYLAMGLAIPLLFFAHRPVVIWSFVIIFGFAMGADYMLIPLVAAECFGVKALGKLLALIIMGYSVGQWVAPWLAGRIFDTYHSYTLAWWVMAIAGVVGAGVIYIVSPAREA
ncbi:MAG: MFS transporter [Terriglobia bacterium]